MTTTRTDRASYIGDLGIKAPVRAATTAAITLNGEQTIDGVAIVTNDRVLVKNQTTASANGIYVADTGAWSRAQDADGPYDLADGTIVVVTDGTSNGDKAFGLSATNPVTPGSTSQTWEQRFDVFSLGDVSWVATSPQPNVSYLGQNARIGADAGATGIAISGVARTSDTADAATSTSIGVTGFAYNDDTGYKKPAYGGYYEAKRVNGSGWAGALELDGVNLGTYLGATPYTSIGGQSEMTFGAWIASGGDATINPTAADGTAAIGIHNNGAKWGTGILVTQNALRDQSATFGTYATRVAMAMAKDQGIHWYNPDGNRAAHLSSLCAAGQKSLGVAFVSTAVRFVDDTDAVQAQIYKTASATSYLSLTGNASAAPELAASSDSASNVDITLTPKGTGKTRTQGYFKNDKGFAFSPHLAQTTDYTVTDSDTVITCNKAGTLTLTLPTASSYPGRILIVRTITANTVVSASSNVVPAAGGAAGTAILAATAGKAAILMSDGTNWQNILPN